jgi:protein-disulfide isomerase
MTDVAVRGAATPRVTLLEYADYQCPYCQQAHPIVDKLEAEFKGKIAFAFKDYPLPMHPDAPKAAEATHCAAKQGKYWEFHDMLFANKQLDVPSLKKDAQELKLDTKAFDACLDNGQMAAVVKDQSTEAQSLGLQGTPTFFVNGRYVSGTGTYERLRGIITEELSAVGGAATTSTESGSRSRPQN